MTLILWKPPLVNDPEAAEDLLKAYYDRKTTGRRDETARRLETIPGIGPFGALLLQAVTGMFHFVTLIGLLILALVVATRSHRLRSD